MKFIYWSLLGCFLMAILAGASEPEAKTPLINLMIIGDMPVSPTEEQKNLTESYFNNLYRDIKKKNLKTTIFSTQDFVNSHISLRLANMATTNNTELAISGKQLNEKLSSESFKSQLDILNRSISYVEGCSICGENEIEIKGFMPQSFDQNEDTYKALDDLGIIYNGGFQEGILYPTGHENDVWPFQVEGHSFYAVPVSSFEMSGEKIPLVDSYAKDKGLSSSQWLDLLKSKFDDAQLKDEPMVVSLSVLNSGTGDYLDAIRQFLDYAVSKNAKFVTTFELVKMSNPEFFEEPASSRGNSLEMSALINTAIDSTVDQENSSECETCDAKSENTSINAKIGQETSEQKNIAAAKKIVALLLCKGSAEDHEYPGLSVGD